MSQGPCPWPYVAVRNPHGLLSMSRWSAVRLRHWLSYPQGSCGVTEANLSLERRAVRGLRPARLEQPESLFYDRPPEATNPRGPQSWPPRVSPSRICPGTGPPMGSIHPSIAGVEVGKASTIGERCDGVPRVFRSP
jgi:hypothetical protein